MRAPDTDPKLIAAVIAAVHAHRRAEIDLERVAAAIAAVHEHRRRELILPPR